MDKYTRKLLKLEDENFEFPNNWLTEEYREGVKYQIIHAYWEGNIQQCKHCRCQKVIRYGTYTRKVKLLDVQGAPTEMRLNMRRYQCCDCGKTMVCDTTIVKRFCNISNQIIQKIVLSFKDTVTKKHIAKTVGVSDNTVHRVMQNIVRRTRQTFSYLPEVLCIDEFKSLKSNAQKMCFIYCDGQTGELLDILGSRRYNYLESHFMTYPRKEREKVRYVVMDMNAHYGGWVKQVFPNATIVTDRFHIVQHINRLFNNMRNVITKRYLSDKSPEKQKQGRRMKRFGKLLLKYESDLNDVDYRYQSLFKREMTETMIVTEVLHFDKDLETAYYYTQEILACYRARDYEGFYRLVSNCPKEISTFFKSKLKIFHKYKNGIRAAFDTTYSNGVLEGLNRKIKLLNRMVYGFRYFTYLRTRVFLIQNKVFKII